MKNIDELLERMNKNRNIIKELLKGSPENFDIDIPVTSDELLAKIEGIILKTKLLIKNTKPDSDDKVINSFFQIIEEPVSICKKLEEKGYNAAHLLKDNYLLAVMIYKYNEGLCERVKNKRLEENNKLLENFLSQINEKQIDTNINKKDQKVAYTISYNSFTSEITYNGKVLSRPRFDSINGMFFQYVYNNPNKNINISDIKLDYPKSPHKILWQLGFKGNIKKAFFNVSKTSVLFRNPLYLKDLEKVSLSMSDFKK